MSETATPDLGTVLRAAIVAGLKNARVALPARVETYDATKQSVDVQPLVYEGYLDEAGKRQAERLPVVAGVPVVFPGAGGFRVTFPIAKGDTVLLVFASSSIDRWLALGGEVDPQDDRRHHLSDAIAIPGLRDFAHALGNAPSSTMSLGKDGGPTIEISGSDIQAGGSSALALKSDVDALITSFNSHTHLYAPGPGSPTPTAAPVPLATTPSVGTSTLKGG
jgi:hypothetical protein